MNRLNPKTTLCTVALITSTWLSAAPTTRPLPPQVMDENAQFRVLRDHKVANQFYVAPKQLEVYEHSLKPFGDQSEGCEAVGHYNKTQRILVETKQEHATASLRRAQLINRLLKQLMELEERLNELVLEKKRLRDKLEFGVEGRPLTEEEKKVVQARLADIEKDFDFYTKRIERIEKLQALAEDEQKKLLAQIKNLEASLEGFEKKVVRPAAKVSVRMRVTEEDLSRTEFRKGLGFSGSDKINLPQLVGIELYPLNFEHLGFLEKSRLAEGIGIFKPEWSVKALEVEESYFGESTLSSSVEKVDFPTKIFFAQVMSLYSYCAVKDSVDAKKAFYQPIRIAYTLPNWKDNITESSGETLISHKRRLTEPQWQKIATLPTISEMEERERPDRGHPSFFTGEGVFEPKSFNLLFTFNID